VGNVNPVTPVPCASLACGISFTVGYSTTFPVTRGPFNSDGTCNFSVPIYVTDFLLTTHTVHFRWPVGAEPVSEPESVEEAVTVCVPSTRSEREKDAPVPIWPWSQRWNYYPSAASGLVAVSVAVLINFGVVF